MASLASYFGLGEQKHRSLDDARMNLEVVKHCATVLFLESSLPSVLEDQWRHDSPPNITTRSRGNVMYNKYNNRLRGKQGISSARSRNKRWPQEATPTMTTRSRSKPYGDETSRKSPPMVLNHHRVVPYPTGSLGQDFYATGDWASELFGNSSVLILAPDKHSEQKYSGLGSGSGPELQGPASGY
ncbi:hypothetical protein Tco_0959845 [Tanacetum coccineum]